MNRINEYNLEPGIYQHYKGGLYVVTELVTHMDNSKGKMEPLNDPIVCYRDLKSIPRHVNGKMQYPHQMYGRPLSSFFELVNGKKRFTKQ